MKTLLWIVAVVCSGAAGFYFGLGYGAETLGAMAAEARIGDGVSRIRVSLQALAQDDPALGRRLHEQNLASALFQIGANASNRAYWHCSDKDRETMEAARKYSQAHPQVLDESTKAFVAHALDLCTAEKGGS